MLFSHQSKAPERGQNHQTMIHQKVPLRQERGRYQDLKDLHLKKTGKMDQGFDQLVSW